MNRRVRLLPFGIGNEERPKNKTNKHFVRNRICSASNCFCRLFGARQESRTVTLVGVDAARPPAT